MWRSPPRRSSRAQQMWINTEFDRLLVSQAQSLTVSILSADAIFDRYDVKRLW
jgi:PIN domain nuclease of toxin-antitoxin system